MYIDKNSIIIDGVNMGQYLTEVEFGYNKLWGTDTGRSLSGSSSGTLLGIFPKLRLNFRKLSRQELEIIAPILDKASQNVTYYDPVLKKNYTMSTYTGDWAVSNRNTFTNVAKANEPFEISFIAKNKRSNS